jgi:hypothetical protein
VVDAARRRDAITVDDGAVAAFVGAAATAATDARVRFRGKTSSCSDLASASSFAIVCCFKSTKLARLRLLVLLKSVVVAVVVTAGDDLIAELVALIRFVQPAPANRTKNQG